MPVFEIVNPSDPYTMVGEFLACALACRAVWPLYAIEEVRPEDAGEEDAGEDWIPLKMPIAPDASWWLATFGLCVKHEHEQRPVGLFLDTPERCRSAAEALRSVLIGTPSGRVVYEAAVKYLAPAQVREFRERRHDVMRSSMNDLQEQAFRAAFILEAHAVALAAALANASEEV